MMKEELRDGEARMNHTTCWDGITKMSERRLPLESFISHKIRPNLEENTHSLLTQKLCIISLL